MTFGKLASLLLFIAVVIEYSSSSPVSIEAEQNALNQGYEVNRVVYRGNASNKTNLHLYPGESIKLYFCLPKEFDVAIDKVAYSNDGPLDNLTISLDGKRVGMIQTEHKLKSGNLWNVIQTNENSITGSVKLSSGLHTIEVKAEKSDKWGVEIDRVQLLVKNIGGDNIKCTDNQIANAGNAIETENPPPSSQVGENAESNGEGSNGEAEVKGSNAKGFFFYIYVFGNGW